MRKIIVLSILFIVSFGVFAQSGGVKWEEGSFSQALEKAKKTSKPVFIDCYTSWCGPCKHMGNAVFTLPQAGAFFNSGFINIKIDMEKGEGIQLKERFEVKAFPTFIILDSNGNETGRIVGGGELDAFIGKVKAAMSPGNSPAALKARYGQGKNVEDAIAYMALLEESYMQDKIAGFVEENYDNFGRALYTEKMWRYIAMSLSSGSVYDKVLADKYEYDENLSRGAVNKAISEVLFDKLVSYLTGKLELTPQQVQQATKDLSFVMEGRNLMLARVVSKLAIAYATNDPEAVKQALNPNFLNQRLTGHERFMLNAYILQKGAFLSDEQKSEYKTKLK